MPEDLSPRRVGRRMLQLVAVVALVAIFIAFGPGLGSLRHHLSHASAGWVGVGVGLEVLSALSYVIVFRAVFCPRMSWRFSYQIGMAEQGANSVLSVSGAGGLALGAWALRRGGMSVDYIGRRTVAFFFLTSLANVGGVILFALLYLAGALTNDRDPVLTYVFGGAATAATLLVLALPRLLGRQGQPPPEDEDAGRVARARHFIRYSLGVGIQDALTLLRQRSAGVLVGSIGTMAFDIAVLGACFKAFGYSPALGVLVMGYLIGQLGGNIPLPAGIGGVDGGLIGTFALYHQPLVPTTAAVLVYHGIAIWVPALLGSEAFVRLRRTLQREERPAAICMPLAEPIQVALPAGVGRSAA